MNYKVVVTNIPIAYHKGYGSLAMGAQNNFGQSNLGGGVKVTHTPFSGENGRLCEEESRVGGHTPWVG